MKLNSSRTIKQPPARKPTQPLPTEPVELTINALSHDGQGIGRYQGKTAFIANALPGEQVLARLTEEKAKFYTGHTDSIITASSHRTEPACPHYHQCGGCDLQHLENSEQLALKQTQVLEQLERIGNTKPEHIDLPLTGSHWHYRRSARIGINQLFDGEPIVGFRRRSSHLLTQIDSCRVLDKRVSDIFSRVREALRDTGDIKYITQIDVDLGDQGGYLSLRLKKPLNDQHLQIFTALAEHYELSLQLQVIGSDPQVDASGLTRYALDQLELTFRPGDFIQVNAEINQQMVNKACQLLQLKPDDKVLDLFCGLGNFSLPVAAAGAPVTGIEGSLTMVEQAQRNALHNQLQNCQFFCANLADDLKGLQWFRQSYNKVILDPPRTGAASLIPQICRLRPELILYISCNPGALARDSKLLSEQGYQLNNFLVMDMFPQTHHIESMALFVRGKKKAPKKKLFSGKGISR
ncbi:23S rRNA (uracil(1939)-C(5))-methyltransferase RlmD [Amphritea pacifica]|uniref:23S rRNA (uracil(1939)-C(5))-methyltransferase RlmD n=1 Tax=Amphritea pacifica TaxID=2811233 RepID=A0ABS2W6R0_9GAMM|nr:23S rRNA (uracil(1939)-C(5))-methyltransferase RlmD [Amphritea pacifica]MBN0987097.1 23S rRNA (uracil(1939)-C(5))-methyltransferase RlmD [Amphritea pacifica]MBN1007170.1 23S rRNA (uracil(1939)-C(5))-methyltransferase RlmD [Amphritea pacifica]